MSETVTSASERMIFASTEDVSCCATCGCVHGQSAYHPELHFHGSYDPTFGLPELRMPENFVTSGGRWTDGGGYTTVLGGSGGTITWSLGGAGLTDVTGAGFYSGASVEMSTFLPYDFEATLQRAFDAWSAHGDIEFVQVADGGGNIGVGDEATIRVVGGYIDGQSGSNVLAKAFFPTTHVAGGDIVFDNGNTNFYANEDYFFLTALHEIGHAIGLDHESTSNAIAIMNPSINTSLEGLQPDDIAGVQEVYGAAPPDLVVNVQRVAGTAFASPDGMREGTTIARGVDMAGAIVIATYTDGTSETLAWQAVDPYTLGEAVGTDIDMSFGSAAHQLTTTKRLATFEIDLQPAAAVWDTTAADEDQDPNAASTPGTAFGFPFEFKSGDGALSGNVGVTYSDIFSLAGSAAAGDLYSTMLVDFTGLDGGGLLGTVEWNSDMDPLDDFVAGVGTTGSVAVNGSATGDRESYQDEDWFAVSLVAGQTYVIDIEGAPTSQGTLSNPYLNGVYDAAGALIAGTADDDGGTGLNSQLTYTATTTGTHYVAAGAFGDILGTYRVSMSFIPALEQVQVNGIAQDLLSYALGQDYGDATVSVDDTTVTLTNNTWKMIDVATTVTADTYLSFDFRSDVEGEIHGIGFDSDNDLSPNWTFQLDGTQTYGLQSEANAYTTGAGWQSYEIRVGDYFQGDFDRLVLVMDDDARVGADSAFRNITVEDRQDVTPKVQVNGIAQDLLSYALGQDYGDATVSVDDTTVTLTNNTWKMIDVATTVTADTYLSFDFRSDVEGEIHGIGFDSDNDLSPNWTFQLDGTQTYGLQSEANAYTTGAGWQSYEIRVGDYFQGDFDRLVLVMDDDARVGADSAFRNITVEDRQDVTPKVQVNGIAQDLLSYALGQDYGDATVSVDDTTVTLTNNTWKMIDVATTVTADTYLSFDFRSDVEGEIHGIGFDSDNDLSPNWTFQLDGTQTYGLQSEANAYTTGAGWQSYEIRVGDYFQGDFDRLVLVMDDDARVGADSAFRNITVETIGNSSSANNNFSSEWFL